MGRRADLPSGAGKDGYVHRNQQWLFGEIPVLDDSAFNQHLVKFRNHRRPNTTTRSMASPCTSCRSPVSSARHIARSVRMSRTTRSCTLLTKVYGSFQAGTTAESVA